MPLEKCPSCGQSVLDVASRCPKCGYALYEARLRDSAEEGASSRGARKRTAPIASLVFGVVLIAAAAAALVIASRSGGKPPAYPTEPPRPVTVAPDSAARDSQPPLDTAPPVVTRVPAGAPARESRWAIDWANVRVGRSVDDSVVMVLRRGRRVDVGERVEGWWMVHLDGRPVGWVAGELLSSVPVDTLNQSP